MEYTVTDLMCKGLGGSLTSNEYNYYLEHFMSSEERQIGKPLFKMSAAEELEYDRLCFNNQVGTLTGYNCPICKNKGEIMVVQGGTKFYPECSCMAVRRSVENMERSNLGELLNKKKFSNYDQTENWQQETVAKAKRFIESDSNCFLFCGTSGCGKTHICTALSGEVLKRGIPLRYMVWTSEAPKIKGIAKDADKYSAAINELENIQALYIDDLFKTKEDKKTKQMLEPTDADLRLAFEIINYRYNLSQTSKKRYITIISTEWTVKQLNDFNSALCGRLCEMAGKGFILSVFGEDKNYRLKTVIGDRK